MKVALIGNPNSGKTALFNTLTGARQKVGNYPGVTVERKEGRLRFSSGSEMTLLDLPGTYSLVPRTPDEEITLKVLLGQLTDEWVPDLALVVVDANHLERGLGFVLELKELGIPLLLALNMNDLAEARGQRLDFELISQELGIPVIPTVAIKKEGVQNLLRQLEKLTVQAEFIRKPKKVTLVPSTPDQVARRFEEVDRLLKRVILASPQRINWTDRIDRWVLHPISGSLILFGILLLLFQSIFNWASVPADLIEAGVGAAGSTISEWLPEGALRSLLVDGVIAGVGAVVVFLPQILILFFFILLLEDSGYMARAAFLMDRLMGKVGLHGKAFIPLLSSYACAIPGVMATRTIEDPRDRLTTILIAPLTTCSARLPVYTLLIAAFVPNLSVIGGLHLQGLVMLGLYVLGLALALLSALVLKRSFLKGEPAPLLLELPTYKWPSFRNLTLGLWERALLFLKKAGTVILSLSVLIWFLVSYPSAPEGASEASINYSFAAMLGKWMEPLFLPIGFDWRLAMALIPGFAAREVMVSALATVYAVEGVDGDSGMKALEGILHSQWSLATALSLLTWYVIAPQCLSTLAVVKKETQTWKWPLVMLFGLSGMAYLFSFLVYHGTRYLTG